MGKGRIFNKLKNKTNPNRSELAKDIRSHRHWALYGGYTRSRNLGSLRRSFGFNMHAFVKNLLKKKATLRILDSGSGFLGISADLKKRFGKRVDVTSLNVIHPYTTRQIRSDSYSKVMQTRTRFDAQLGQAARKKTSRRAGHIDRIKVSSAERFVEGTKYDIILDIYSALHYSSFKGIVLENYAKLLKPNGILLTTKDIEVPKRTYTDKQNGEKFVLAKTIYINVASWPISGGLFAIEKVPL